MKVLRRFWKNENPHSKAASVLSLRFVKEVNLVYRVRLVGE